MIDEPFSEEFSQEFYRQYEKLKRQRFEPTLATLSHNLKTLLDSKFGTSPRLRLRVENGRIKSANRLLLKAQLPRYRSGIKNPCDIFTIIRDIVGTRITCNTIRDAYAVAREIKTVATNGQPDRTFVLPCDDFEDDYIKTPKESGYRALSLLVGVPVAIGDHTEAITSEIQIRTLLQHAWGELTHEDTYKPEMKTPDLIVILSKRLADALAVLDEIAQDIRNELDKLETEQADPLGIAESSPTPEVISTEPLVPVPVAAPDASAAPTEKATAAQQQPPQPKASVSMNAVQAGFRAAFGRDPQLDEKLIPGLLERLNDQGLSEPGDIERALRGMSERLAPIEAKYEGAVSLSDYGRLMQSAAFINNPEAGLRQLERVFARNERKRREKEEFEVSFQPGKEVLGTVVHVAPDYALVQLPEGVTGIIHVTAMKRNPRDYLDVHEVVKEGETVRVRIVASDPITRRIALSLVPQ
jgi:ppGpp synthetase/RelA/SpoT-type nucleotidyltranferase/predicted RNA-binding protein with RPS1 domain